MSDRPTRPKARTMHLVPASTIAMRPVTWLWESRIALGTLALVAGRAGIGKSTVTYHLVALLTRGTLNGVYFGQPKSVLISATEDSWAHTIVPRLVAAGADLTRVFRCDVHTRDGADVPLSLPMDLGELDEAIRDVDAGLILLDPLISRLSGKLDTHKDAEVRLALEPLVALADTRRCAIVGLIHLSKSASTDPLTSVMGSAAFGAVARSLLYVMHDPEDPTKRRRLLGTPKVNLGLDDLPTLTFTIESKLVGETDEGPIYTGALDWGEPSTRGIEDALETQRDAQNGDKSSILEATDWLKDYLERSGPAESIVVKRDAQKEGHAVRTLQRARERLRVTAESRGYPRRTFWALPSTATIAAAVDEVEV